VLLRLLSSRNIHLHGHATRTDHFFGPVLSFRESKRPAYVSFVWVSFRVHSSAPKWNSRRDQLTI